MILAQPDSTEPKMTNPDVSKSLTRSVWHPVDAEGRSSRGLDEVNFFVAAMQTGFGAFVTVYLVENLWPPQAIGFALTVATMSSLLSQIPAGAALDSMRDKRGAVLLGIAGVGLAALLLCVTAARGAVYLALAVQGLASSLIGPGIAAISLVWVLSETHEAVRDLVRTRAMAVEDYRRQRQHISSFLLRHGRAYHRIAAGNQFRSAPQRCGATARTDHQLAVCHARRSFAPESS